MCEPFKDEDVDEYVVECKNLHGIIRDAHRAYIGNCHLSLSGVLRLLSFGHHVFNSFTFRHPCTVIVENIKDICDFVISNKMMTELSYEIESKEEIILYSTQTPFDSVQFYRFGYLANSNIELFFVPPLSFVKNFSYHSNLYHVDNDGRFFELVKNNSQIESIDIIDCMDTFNELFLNSVRTNRCLKKLRLCGVDAILVDLIIDFINQHTSLRDIGVSFFYYFDSDLDLHKQFKTHLNQNYRLHRLFVDNKSVGKKFDAHLKQNKTMHSNVQYICVFLLKRGSYEHFPLPKDVFVHIIKILFSSRFDITVWKNMRDSFISEIQTD